MIWNTDLINDVVLHYEKDKDIKSLLRNITIDKILSDDIDSKLEFPFMIEPLTNDLIFRAPNILFQYTDDELRKLIEVSTNPELLFNLVQFTPYEFQKKWLDDYVSNRFNLFKTSRQIGSTTMSMFCALHFILFNKDKSVLSLNMNNGSMYDTLTKFTNLYNSLPFYIKPGIINTKPTTLRKYAKKAEIQFDNGCSIEFRVGSNLYLGKNIDFLINDGVLTQSIISNYLPIMIAMSRSRILSFSSQSQNINPLFEYRSILWDAVPGRDIDWLKEKIRQIGIDSLISEYNFSDKSILRELKIETIIN
jgi:hypothetical protein